MAFEARDPFLIRQVSQIPTHTLKTATDNQIYLISIIGNPHTFSMHVQMREEPSLTDWDRFARREYVRLAMEEDGEDASNASGDVWDESLESPF